MALHGHSFPLKLQSVPIIVGILSICSFNLPLGDCTGELIENYLRDSNGKLIPSPVPRSYPSDSDTDLSSVEIINQNIPPKIIFENDYGSFHVNVKCLGQGVNSLAAIQCNSPIDCKKQISCFDNNSKGSSCPKGKRVYRGERCVSLNGSNSEDCFQLEDRRWQLTSGLIECTKISPDGSHSQRTIQQFFKGTDQFFHLVQANEFQLNLDVMEKTHEPPIHIEYVGKPVFYTNKKVNVHCRATKFLFNSISIIAVKSDGSNFPINATATLPGDDDKYWEQFYLEAYEPGMDLTTDLVAFTCTAQRYDSTEWTETTFQFTTAEPTKPIIDKSKETKKIVWSTNQDDHQSVACNYTGGPADIEIIRQRDGQNVVDRFISAYGLIRETKGILQRFNYEQEGNYTCSVTNSLGNDSFQFYLDIPRSHVTSIHNFALVLLLPILMVVIGN